MTERKRRVRSRLLHRFPAPTSFGASIAIDHARGSELRVTVAYDCPRWLCEDGGLKFVAGFSGVRELRATLRASLVPGNDLRSVPESDAAFVHATDELFDFAYDSVVVRDLPTTRDSCGTEVHVSQYELGTDCPQYVVVIAESVSVSTVDRCHCGADWSLFTSAGSDELEGGR